MKKLLSIYDCKNSDDVKLLLSNLEGMTDLEYIKATNGFEGDMFLRKCMIDTCKRILLFYDEKKNGFSFLEIEWLFFLHFGRYGSFNRFYKAAKLNFEASQSLDALFRERFKKD